ncbi:MAG TPA: DUF4082 domain-containing protein [Bryobacteraceae bacterium]|nr:hypothetical protein [Bryobacterales bacterium]HRJ19857.1 DUF4082 domain-containing protein [Bryobacteraceae bacterium]
MLKLVLAVVCSCGSMMGATLALNATDITEATAFGSYTTGWMFSSSNPLNVTALGYYDSGGDGLADTHDVGIFTSGGVLLVSTTVPSGTAGTLEASWRFADISPFLLPAGTYVIAGTTVDTSADLITTFGNTTLAVGLTLVDNGLFAIGSDLTFPTELGNGYYNANFLFDPVDGAIPEPSTWVMGASALVLLGLRRVRQGRAS